MLHLAQAVLGEAAHRRAVLLAVDEVAQVGGAREVRLVLQARVRLTRLVLQARVRLTRLVLQARVRLTRLVLQQRAAILGLAGGPIEPSGALCNALL